MSTQNWMPQLPNFRPVPPQNVRQPQPVRAATSKSFWDWMRPLVLILGANLLLLIGLFLLMTIILSPAGIAAGWVAGKLAWRGIKELAGR